MSSNITIMKWLKQLLWKAKKYFCENVYYYEATISCIPLELCICLLNKSFICEILLFITSSALCQIPVIFFNVFPLGSMVEPSCWRTGCDANSSHWSNQKCCYQKIYCKGKYCICDGVHWRKIAHCSKFLCS